ncbi:MAG TPA: hypothetical protein VGC41_00020 [Kofleriaceae bacterium]
MAKWLLMVMVMACSHKSEPPASGSGAVTASPTSGKPDCANIAADAQALFKAPPKPEIKSDSDDTVSCNYSASGGTMLMITISSSADRPQVGANEDYPNKKKLSAGDSSWSWGSQESVSVTVRAHGHDCMAIYNRPDDHKDEAPELSQDDAAQKLSALCLHAIR